MGKYRMIEPWGYQEENDYVSKKSQIDQELDKNRKNDEKEFASIDELSEGSLADAKYDKESESLIFYNKDGEAKATVPMTDIIPSDLVKSVEYDEDAKKIIITFDNDDTIEIPVEDLANVVEAGDGLKSESVGGSDVFSVFADENGEKSYVDNEPYIEVSSNGVNVKGINLAVSTEKDRAEAVEQELDAKIDTEKNDREGADAQLSEAIEAVDAKVDAIDLAPYATMQWVEDKHYLTEHQDISNLATKDEVAAVDAKVDAIDLTPYATKTEVEAVDAKVDAVDAKVDAIDLTPYATKTEVEAVDAKVDAEETARKEDAIASVEYVKADVKMYFKNANGVVVSEVGVDDFIKDGMLEDAEIVEEGGVKYLRLTLNTDGESKVIDIAVADIFNPDLYYTKTESDAMYGTKAEVAAVDAKVDAIDLTPYATKTEVEAVDAKVDAIDLTPYAKEADVEASLALKADKTEIPTDFYTQEEVNVMMSELLTRIENVESNVGVVVASSAADIAAAAVGSNLVVTSAEAIEAMTANKEYSTVTIVGGTMNADMKAIASEKVTVDGLGVNGGKGASNGKMQISADTVAIKNVTIATGTTAYNVFESSQNTANTSYFTESYVAENIMCDNTQLNHNIFNIYTFKDNATVTIKDSYFNLDVDSSNALRVANYTNAENVTIEFENVEWTYENSPGTDWGWAGLVIYQPASSDVALNGDMSKIATWTFKFKNCKYNGEVVDAVNYGQHNQVLYGYNINKSGVVSDISGTVNVVFE